MRFFCFLSFALIFGAVAQAQLNPNYYSGPNVNTPAGRELRDLLARFPDYAGISVLFTGEQKFRPVMGPVILRMLTEPNSIKVLVQGQDATHIAEAAGYPATAGFGGRAMDVGSYLGVGPSMGFMNAYAATITGQYGYNQSPIVEIDAEGKAKGLIYKSVVSNPLWTMSMNPKSEIAKFRNDLLSWILKNNQDSLRLVVLFGGASRDAFASFVESKGGNVGTFLNPNGLQRLRVPVLKSVGTGGNGEAAYPLTKDGKDLYELVLRKYGGLEPNQKINYKLPQKPAKGFVSDMDRAKKLLEEHLDEFVDQMQFVDGGIAGSGVVHPGQLGGYDIDHQMQINGATTVSLKGLKVDDAYTVKQDIIVRQFPHPTRLSMMGKEEAAEAVAQPLQAVRYYMEHFGFEIDNDPGFVSNFVKGLGYAYARADIGPETYAFGTPRSRMVNVSSGVRAGKNVIIFGSREKSAFIQKEIRDRKTGQVVVPQYDQSRVLKQMAAEKPHLYPAETENWTMMPRSEQVRYGFDPGPGGKYAQIMKNNIPQSLIDLQPTNGDYGHYRGRFEGSRVLVLADPHGYDDLLTSRALTGARGQYLHGLMEQAGVGDQYLVIKTAPFSKEAWAPEAWAKILEETKTYREKLIQEILSENLFDFVLLDGEDALAEWKRITQGRKNTPRAIALERSGMDPMSGLAEAARQIRKISGYSKFAYEDIRWNIPRSHLFYNARWWEGTSGDRVITSTDPKMRGKAFAMVAPDWAWKQKYQMPESELKSSQSLLEEMTEQLRRPVPLNDCNFLFLNSKQKAEAQPWIEPKKAS